MNSRFNLIGKKFGMLTVESFAGSINNCRMWSSCCECGSIKIISGTDLKSGKTKSCGCLKKKMMSGLCRERFKKHGQAGANFSDRTGAYRSWQSMLARTRHSKKQKCWERYVGINVDPRWMDFDNFYLDMGDKPSMSHSIDRIDGTKGYFKENCRWATASEQARNRTFK